jgi:N-sulfoglucosamine sulfohydrolase
MKFLFAMLVLNLLTVAWCTLVSAREQPNFVIVLADDVGWDAFGCTGAPHARTPHIDELARKSVVMDRLYTSVSQCAPQRAEFYTGLLPMHNGVLANSRKEERSGILNIADHLRPMGYRVGLTGKSHFRLGQQQFDRIDGFTGNANGDIAEYDLSGVRTYIREAQSAGSPFCVFICSVHAHHPWTVGDESHFPHEQLRIPPHYVDTPATRKAIAIHAAEVEEFDRQVGDVRAMLNESKLENDTILIVLSEQGIAMPRGKWSPYDHGSRAVCIAHWPGHFVPKKTSAIAMYSDFVPTFIDFAGGQSQVPLDGKSLKSLWLDERDKHRQSAFISNVHPFWQKAIVTEQYKLIWTGFPNEDHIHSNFASTKFFGKAWSEWKEASEKNRDVAAKIIRVLHPKRYELYDIQNDPYEVHDLAENGQHQNVKLGLLAELKQLMADAGESLEPKQPQGKEMERTRRRKKR